MAVETGTATDWVDFYDKLFTFLTSNADLVAAGEQWEVMNGASTPFTALTSDDPDQTVNDVVLKGPGLAGNDEVYVSMRALYKTSSDAHVIYFRGHAGLVGGNNTYDGHVNTSPLSQISLWSQSIGYWFIANGRRFIVVAKVGTVYESAYCGLFLPYSTPAGYPYPLMIGGTSGVDGIRYSDTDTDHSCFVDPAYSNGSKTESALQVLHPNGSWESYANREDNDGEDYYDTAAAGRNTFPMFAPSAAQLLDLERSGSNLSSPAVNYRYKGRRLREDFIKWQRPAFGGSYVLTPITLVSRINGFGSSGADALVDGVHGVMQGLHFCPGYGGQAAENIVQIDGVDHLVVQNCHRTAAWNFFTVALD